MSDLNNEIDSSKQENSIDDNKNVDLLVNIENNEIPCVQMSKRQLKKLKKREKWESVKKLKRLKEREKYRLKKLAAIEKGEQYAKGPSRKELKRKRISSETCNVTVAIDLTFNELMSDDDIGKCVKQLLRAYTINRRSNSPINLYFTSLVQGNRFHKILEKNDGYENWDVKMKSESFIDVFDKDRIIYLSSDSENVLNDLEKDKVYVIGGLVDHNHSKGVCLDKANKLGIKHARLPLSEYVSIETRTVLSIYHGK